MIDRSVARRYAHALFSLARDKDILDRVQEDIEWVVKFIQENEDLQKVLNHQLYPLQGKKELVEKILVKKL